MSDVTNANVSAGIDLTQFHQVFFEEAGENLDTMERLLLEIDLVSADDEELNAIFRCAHSVKGGAATFGFSDVAALTHQMETLLDKLRRHELAPTSDMVDVLLQSGDALKAQLGRHQGKHDEVIDTTALNGIRDMSSGAAPIAPATNSGAPASDAPLAAAAEAPAAAPALDSAAAPSGPRLLELTIGPAQDNEAVDTVVSMFAEIVDLGKIEPLDGGTGADGMRRFKVTTTGSDAELLDLITFHVDASIVRLAPLGAGYGFHSGAPGAPVEEPIPTDHGFFDGAPGLPSSSPVTAGPVAVVANARPAAKPVAASTAESATLRVSVDKVDQLINLVGELVITQAMMAQCGSGLELAAQHKLAAGLADLERNTRDLQTSVMSIRMIPMSAVFNRFPRMLRDLATKLQKKVDFVTLGEATELDKGMVEKITDPLTHLVRNSCDHGIELPAERLAKGKSEIGTITLAASHQGGSIVIEVRDDGKGLSREKLIKKARERGIPAPDSMSDADAWALIFAPGFSTAEEVTDVSGRGVGMDVVKKNIAALGGAVEINSSEGYGMSVKVRLPLTLAIMDSMSIRVGDECYIVPLASVIESFQFSARDLKTIAGTAQVIKVRDEFLPVLHLTNVFEVQQKEGQQAAGSIMLLVEANGNRAGLVVDELVGQQQVVVKNLEANFGRVENISGATIIGDGRVALILDVEALVRRALQP
jgi:two-component system chemotaxis sensor kinase CheA